MDCLNLVHCLLLSSPPTFLSLLQNTKSTHTVSPSPPHPPCSKLYLLWCRMLSLERQYVAVLKGVEETYLPLLELSDTPASIRGKADTLFPNWTGLSNFHSQNLLPAMEGALVQSLLQQDCFSKYVSGHNKCFMDLPSWFSATWVTDCEVTVKCGPNFEYLALHTAAWWSRCTEVAVKTMLGFILTHSGSSFCSIPTTSALNQNWTLH